MSFASSGGGRGSPVLPPEKGVFPLDHFGECAPRKAAYLACLDAHGANGATVECRKLAKQYLECRMGKGLMVEQDLGELGYSEAAEARASRKIGTDEEVAKVKEGFVAGLPRGQQDKRQREDKAR